MTSQKPILFFLISTFFLTLSCWSASVHAQTYNQETYLDLELQADTAFAAMEALEPNNQRRAQMATWALEDRIAQIDYLGDWRQFGQMDAETLAFTNSIHIEFLLRDVVILHTELGRCTDARHNAAVLEHLAMGNENLSIQAAVAEAWEAVGRCGEPHGELLSLDGPTNSQVVESSTEFNPTWITLGGVATVFAGIYVMAVPLRNTNSEIRRWNSTHPDGDPADEEIQTLDQKAENQNLLAATLMLIGATGIVSGVAWNSLRSNQNQQTSHAIGFFPLEQGAILQARWVW